ncbi:MAG: DUF1592 domain-containing protein [Archangiaceae bacterium]|nr:DUF1592 domain-containing protein [Archangiaceae bacterium]
MRTHLFLLVFLCACEGQIATGTGRTLGGTVDPTHPGGSTGTGGGSTGPGEAPLTPPTLDAASAALRRLSPAQYQQSLRDLLDAPTLTLDLPEDNGIAISMLTAEKLNSGAEAIIATQAHRKLVPCAIATGDPACGFAFIDAFGARAFRHPLDADERAWLRGVFTQARTQLSFSDSIDVVAEVVLQSGHVFYLNEQGHDVAGLPAGLKALTAYERASRLSYFLWGTMPDDALLAAAADGTLDTEAGVSAQAQRLMQSPRASSTWKRFVDQWLELDGNPVSAALEDAIRNSPRDTPALRTGMRAEVEALMDKVMGGTGSLHELFTTRDAYVNADLAKVYGVTPPASGSQWVTLDSTQRAGLFTRGAFLLLNATPNAQSPIRRGAWTVKRAFCTPLGPPPPNASDTPILSGATQSLRDSVAAATSSASCSGCHSVINPAGFGLQNYDQVGAFATVETGKSPDGSAYSLPLDVSGQFVHTDVSEPFVGPLAFSEKLAQSRKVHDCVARRWFSSAFAREPQPSEATSLAWVQGNFAKSDDMRALIASMVSTPAFLYVRAAP